jgi:hypothetical protein
MTVLNVVQGSEAWLQARLGKPTASNYHRLITAKSAKPSASAERYLHSLIVERIFGVSSESASSGFMERGSLLEETAVRQYEFAYGVETERVGFVTALDGRTGCSPDRIVGADGLLEIKACSAEIHVGAMLGATTDDHRAQCQGQLWITGRQWVDLYHFNPDLPPAVVRLERDPEFIEALSEIVIGFCERLDAATTQVQAMMAGAKVA